MKIRIRSSSPAIVTSLLLLVSLAPDVVAQLFPPPPSTQVTPPTFTFAKQANYVQTDASAISGRGGRFYVFVSSMLYTTSVSFDVKLEVADVTHRLGVDRVALERAYETTAELERVFPSNTLAKITVSWAGGQREYVMAVPSSGPMPEPPITNIAALQNWDGGAMEISWRLPTITSIAPPGTIITFNPGLPPPSAVPPLLSPTGINLYVYRASNIDFGSSAPLLNTAAASGGGVTLAGIEAGPGETLHGELRAGTFANIGSIRFPIRRAPALSAAAITVQPKAQNARIGEDITLSVEATGADLAYQWIKDGTAITGATHASLELKSIRALDAGSYTVAVANPGGQTTSDAAIITVLVPPTIASAPGNQAVVAGTSVSFEATANGSAPLTYQWHHDGSPIAGATANTFRLASPRIANSGSYTVAVSNAAGTTTSAAARLEVLPVTRISNLSIRSVAGGDAGMLTLGLTISGGTAGELKPLLLRAIGPTLAVFGVDGTLADPQLALLTGSGVVAQNDDWAGSAQVRAAGDAVGAFALANDGSKDAALAHSPAAGGYTVQITGAGSSSGVTLAEVYDTTPSDTFVVSTPRLTNVSALTHVGTGADGLFAGFSISGATPKTVLVRGIGPTLAGFGLSAVLADPKLDLYQAGAATPTSTNDDWGAAPNATQIAAAAASVGAFALAADSRDAVLLVTLPPGSYSAQISGVNNTTGMALVEVYEVP